VQLGISRILEAKSTFERLWNTDRTHDLTDIIETPFRPGFVVQYI